MQKRLIFLILTSISLSSLTALASLVAETPIPAAPPVEKAWFATSRSGAAREQIANSRAKKRALSRQARKAELDAQPAPKEENTRTALIFLDDYEINRPEYNSAVLTNMIVALVDQAGFIIASGSQLCQAFSVEYKGQSAQAKNLINLLRIIFDSKKWIVRKINEQSNLFLLLPKADFADKDWQAIKASGNNNSNITTSLEIKLGIKIDHMLAISEIEEAQDPQKAIQNYFDSHYEQYSKSASQKVLASDFMHAVTNNNIFVPRYKNWHLPNFALYVDGHGAYEHSIAGISIIAAPGKRSAFQQLLDYLEKKINTKLFVYHSCYAAGFNATLVYGELTEQAGTQTYSFTIATASTSDVFTMAAVSLKPNVLPLSFNVSFKQFVKAVKKNIIDYKKVIPLIIPQGHLSSIAHVRPANSPAWFALSELDTAVITIGRVKALALEKNKQPLIIKQYKDSAGILQDPTAILIGTPNLNFPIVIDKNIKKLPTFISTLAGAAIHTFDSITYEGAPFDVGDFVGYGDIQYGPIKKFIINSIFTIDPTNKPESVKDVEIAADGPNIDFYGLNTDGSPHAFPAKKMFSKLLLDASMKGDFNTATYALSNGADINFQDPIGNSALLIAIYTGNKQLAEFLISNGADTQLAGNGGATPLHVAARSGNTDIIELIMTKNIKPDVPDIQGSTALHAAIEGDINIVKLLIKHGFTTNVATQAGFTPLHIAAATGKKDIADLLIQEGADVNAQTANGYTSLHAAAATGNIDIAKLLIEKGVQVNTQSEEGDTALHVAAALGNKELVELLLQHGADTSIKNKKGETALDLALQEKKDVVAAMLREYEAQHPKPIVAEKIMPEATPTPVPAAGG